MNQHSYTIFIIAALVLFGIYRRVRRNIGWQPLNQRNLRFRTVLLGVVGLIFLAEGAMHPISLISDFLGIVLGIALAYYSAGITIFEQREEHLYYRPNTWIGSTVTAIFLVRLIYRFYELYEVTGVSGLKQGQTNGFETMSAASGSSWFSGLILIMFAYYVFYYMILLRKQKPLLQSDQNKTD